MEKDKWLERQCEEVAKEIQAWPEWMRREAGLEKTSVLNYTYNSEETQKQTESKHDTNE